MCYARVALLAGLILGGLMLGGCGRIEQPPREALGGIPSNEAERHIVYHGELALVTGDLSRFERELEARLGAAQGFVADFHEVRQPGLPRAARWTVRIPAARFAETVAAVGALGEVLRRQLNSEDVTEAYVDLEARLRNQQRLENRLVEIVEKKTGDVNDLLSVEKELGRVRQEIERLEGQRRTLAERVALSTLVIDVRESPDFTPLAEQTLGHQVGAAFFSSLDLLRGCGQAILLAAVFLAPWLLAALLLIGPPWLIARWRRALVRAPDRA